MLYKNFVPSWEVFSKLFENKDTDILKTYFLSLYQIFYI